MGIRGSGDSVTARGAHAEIAQEEKGDMTVLGLNIVTRIDVCEDCDCECEAAEIAGCCSHAARAAASAWSWRRVCAWLCKWAWVPMLCFVGPAALYIGMALAAMFLEWIHPGGVR